MYINAQINVYSINLYATRDASENKLDFSYRFILVQFVFVNTCIHYLMQKNVKAN